jgi:hypothetical protein
MLTTMMRSLRWLFAPAPREPFPSLCVPEWSEAMAEHQAPIWWRVKPYTKSSAERIVVLCQSIAYLEKHNIPGAIVGCGVGKGGGMMAAAMALMALESTRRQFYLHDTFAGMPAPAPVDVDWQGRPARDLLPSNQLHVRSSLHDVKQAMMLTRYPWEKLIFVPGRVEQTIPEHTAGQIALLRLNTHWYDSTYHNLEKLYPRLADGGIMIVDDYGAWQGARKAVDDYFQKKGMQVPLQPIDFAGRFILKKPQPQWTAQAA